MNAMADFHRPDANLIIKYQRDIINNVRERAKCRTRRRNDFLKNTVSFLSHTYVRKKNLSFHPPLETRSPQEIYRYALY